MNTWLSWELDEFAFPMLTGKARELYHHLGLVHEFLPILSRAGEALLREYQVPIYETLKDMAAHDDRYAIGWLLRECPFLELDGYYDGCTALGVAAREGALNAMDELWHRGAGSNLCIGLNMDALEFCWQYDVPEEAVRSVFRHGAPVELQGVLTLLYEEEYALLRMVLEESRPEQICGKGVGFLIEAIHDYLCQGYGLYDTLPSMEKSMALLEEFL